MYTVIREDSSNMYVHSNCVTNFYFQTSRIIIISQHKLLELFKVSLFVNDVH